MSIGTAVVNTVRRVLGRHHPDPHSGDSYYYQTVRRDGAGVDFDRRWTDIALVADLRPTDSVLDIGCAEGLIAIEVAQRVRAVHGVEVLEHRVEAARKRAHDGGTGNVTFAQGSIVDNDLPPLSFDVSLFLGLYGYPTDTGRIGNAELAKTLNATRRQIVLRVDVQDDPGGLTCLSSIYQCFDAHGFGGICFPKVSPRHGNIILGNRRGAGARLPYLPPVVLVPSDAAIASIQDAVTSNTVRDASRWAHVLDDDLLSRLR